jgi:hypothetical protein
LAERDGREGGEGDRGQNEKGSELRKKGKKRGQEKKQEKKGSELSIDTNRDNLHSLHPMARPLRIEYPGAI